MSAELRLHPDDLRALAVAFVDELDARGVLGAQPAAPAGWVDAKTLADLLNVSADWVRAHADELGAKPLGDGPKPRLRFDIETARAAVSCLASRRSLTAEPAPVAEVRRRRSGRNGTGPAVVPLLPVRPPSRRNSGTARNAGTEAA